MLTYLVRQRHFVLVTACALAATALAGCMDPDNGAPSGAAGPFVGTDFKYPDGGVQKTPTGTGAAATGSGAGVIDVSRAPTSAPVPVVGGATSGGMTSGGGAAVITQHPCGTPPCVPAVIPPGQLTAGEWNDLAHWDFFLNMLTQTNPTIEQLGCGGGACPTWGAAEAVWGLFPTGRVPVSVLSGGKPAVNVPVELRDGQGKILWKTFTDKQGSAQLFIGMLSGPDSATLDFATVHAGGAPGITKSVADRSQLTLPGSALAPVVLTLPAAAPPAPALDLMLMVDTTGSMGDELQYIKSELQDVVTRVKARLPAGAVVRLSVNFYKDLKDEYVVRAYPFTTDVDATVDAIGRESAGGGDDTPEAVDHALQVAVDEHDWDAAATARLLILVLDAPPHQDPPTLARVQAAVVGAAAKGIQIIPVGASGIDKDTELLLRFFAIATDGTYAFLTDDSGIGNDHLDPSPTIGAFDVELLNDLLVRVITERL